MTWFFGFSTAIPDKMKVHRKNTSSLIDRLILSYGIVLLVLFSAVPPTQTIPQCYGNVDLIFVVDASYSVSDQNFLNMVDFIGDVVGYLYESINSDLRVGLIPYASSVYAEIIHLNGDQSNVLTRIIQLQRDEGNILTNTSAGLSAMLTMFQDEGRDQVDTDTTYISVLITDGLSNDPVATQLIAMQIEISPLNVHVLPIGVSVDQEPGYLNELNTIATQDAKTTIRSSLADNSLFHLEFSKDICFFTLDFKADPVAPKDSLEFDIYFLVDESSYVLPLDFVIIKTFIKNILKTFEISDTMARVALFKYGTSVLTGSTHMIAIDELNVEAALFSKIDGLYLNALNEDYHDISQVLTEAQAMIDVSAQSGRPVIIVLLTGGVSTSGTGIVNSNAAITKAMALNALDDVYVVVVGAGADSVAWKSERDSMAFTSVASFRWDNFVVLEDKATTDAARDLLYRIITDEFVPPPTPGPQTEWEEEFDIIFMIDGSIKASSAFNFFKFIVATLIRDQDYRFALSDTTGRVGVMVFDANGVYQIIQLGDYTDRADLLVKINALQIFARTAEADNAVAIAQMRAHFNDLSNLRRSAARIAYLITTSTSDYELLSIAEARAAAYDGIQLLILGINILGQAQIDATQLGRLVVFPDSVASVDVRASFASQSTAALNSYSTTIQHFAAIPRPTGTLVSWDTGFDLVVLLHDAAGQPTGSFDAQSELLELLTNRHVVGTGPNEVQVGVITFGAGVNSGVGKRIQLGADSNMGTLSIKLLTLDLTPTGGPNIDAAIDDMLAMFASNGRAGVARVALLLIQGNPQDYATAAQMVSINDRISNAGISMFSIGLGQETDINVMQELAFNRYLTTQTFADWKSLEVSPKLDAGLVAMATGAIGAATTSSVQYLTRICSSPAGIVFLVDVSESMIGVFVTMKNFVKTIMSGFNYENVEIGVVGFSSTYKSGMIINLGQYNNYVQLVLAFDAAIQLDTEFMLTGTGDALAYMRTMFRNRGKSYQKMAVVISDGMSFDPVRAKQEASAARAEGISIAAIGVGNSVFRAGLRDLTGDDEYIFELSNADLTDPVRQEAVQDLLCTWADTVDVKCNIPMDLVFVVDASSSLGPENFRTLRETLFNLVNRLNIGPGDDQTRVGLVKIGENVPLAEALSLTDSEISLVTRILFLTGDEQVTDTAAALETMRGLFADGGRDYNTFPHIAVVFTDGISSNPFQTKLQSAIAQQAGIYMIAVGLDSNVFLPEMTAIASDEQQSLLLFNTVSDLLVYDLHEDICEAARQYKPPAVPPPPTLTGYCQTNMDMVFVLDASQSVIGFSLISGFLLNFAGSLNGLDNLDMDIGLDKIRIGIIAYSDVVHTSEIFRLQDSVDITAVTVAIKNQVQGTMPGTVTHEALAEMRNMFSEGRPNTPFVGVVITDGRFSFAADLQQTRTQALLALDEGIHMVAVGFGNVQPQALYYMATDPASVRILLNTQTFLDPTFETDLLELACASGYTCTAPMNLIVVWDLKGGEAIAQANRFIADLILTFTLSTVTNIFVDNVASVDLAIQDVIDLIDSSSDDGITQALLIITDKQLSPTVKTNLDTETTKVKGRGGIVSVVDAASMVNNLENVASSRELYFKTSMFDVMPHTLVIKRSLCIMSCASGYQLDPDTCKPCPLNTYRDNQLDGKLCVDCPNSQYTENTATTDINDCLVGRCMDPMDIVIVIDASSSISRVEFQLINAALTNLVTELDISPERTRVALVPFSTTVLSPQVFDLERSTNKKDVIRAIRVLDQTLRDGTTNTANAIDVARGIFLTQGRRVAASLPNIPYTMLVITDGRSDNTYRTIEEADIAKRSFIRILSVGVGLNVFRLEVESIASDENSVMFVNSFFSLFTTNLIGPLCEDVFICPSTTLEIDFFYDIAASSVLKTKINTFYGRVDTDFTGATLAKQEYTDITNMVSTLNTLALAVNTNPQNAKVVLIITEGDITEQSVKGKAAELRDLGIVLIVIDAGVAIDNTNFLQIVFNDNLLFETENFQALPYYRYIERSLCIAPCPAGQERDTDGWCTDCGRGLYRVATVTHTCTPCIPGFNTLAEGAESSAACVRDCGPGTFDSGSACEPCTAGSYQANSFKTSCTPCGSSMTTMGIGSTSAGDCIADCGVGSYRQPDESGCLPCPENTYQPATLQIQCIRCPTNLLAPVGSDSLDDCVGRCPTDMDIVFLVDASRSISPPEFSLLTIFIVNTITSFVVGPTKTRFGIIEFANEVLLSPRLNLDESVNRDVAIQEARLLIQGAEAGTNTAAGFQTAIQMFFNQGRVGIAHHIIVITDGLSNSLSNTVLWANEAKMSFIYITSIGVGDRIFEQELRQIATDDSSFIKVPSFFNLIGIDILDDICIDTFSCSEGMDLFIIRHVDVLAQLTNINTFISSLGNSYTEATTVSIDSGATTDKLTADINQVPVGTGNPSNTKVVVIFTDKPTTETAVDSAAASLKDAGYLISVVYIGTPTADSSSFDGIRSTESLMFQTADFFQLPYNRFIIRSLCVAPCPAGEERDAAGTCVSCVVGSYRAASQDHKCVLCPNAGQYTLDTGSTSVADCLPTSCSSTDFTCVNNAVCSPATMTCCVPSADRCDGMIECSDSSDEDGCNFCTAGQYFNSATKTCIDCLRGSYQPTERSTSCISCPSGTTTMGTKSTDRTDCNVICDENGKELSVSTGFCIPCPFGTYRNKDLHPRCVPCRDKFTTPTTMSVAEHECVPDCPAGQMWNAILEACVLCRPGTYMSLPYQYACLSCPPGTVSPGGATIITQCTDPCSAAGTELPLGGTSAAECVPCEQGTYKDSSGTSTVCEPCPGGFTTATTGATSVAECLRSTLESSPPETILVCCKNIIFAEKYSGTYKDGNRTSTICESCPDGFTTPTIGATIVADCLPPCVKGQKYDAVAKVCVYCPLKTYQNMDYQSTCNPCPDGQTTTHNGADSAADCMDICPPGTELPAIGTVDEDCVPCQQGYYKDNSGTSSTCQPCAAGYTNAMPGSMTKNDCVRNCPAGSRIDGTNCVLCVIGFYQPNVRQTSCFDCGLGKSTTNTGSTNSGQCIDVCNSGSELVQRDPLQCDLCVEDTYRVKDDHTECQDCPTNHMTIDVGATSLAECLPNCEIGQKMNQATLSCVPCPKGTFQPLKYQYDCTDCPLGRTTISPGATSLSQCVFDCEEGTRWEDALTRCLPCGKDEFQPLKYQASCDPCPAGTTTGQLGSTLASDCTDPCQVGEVYNPSVGLGPAFPSCEPCPVGTYKGLTHTTCQACEAGYMTDSAGSTSVDDCKPPCVAGEFWDATRLTCRPCEAGTYQANPHQTSCDSCPQGGTTSGTGATDVSQCIAPSCNVVTEWQCDSGQCITLGDDCDGTADCADGSDETDLNCCDDGYARNAADTCDQCPAGTFRTRRVHTTCQVCPTGFTTRDPGQTSEGSCIANCPAGQRWNGIQCINCPVGTYQDEPYQTTCTDCNTGHTTATTGTVSASLCIDKCESGTELLSPTADCTSCPKGTYRTKDVEPLCVTCQTSYTTAADGSGKSVADCVPDCPMGTYWDGTACEPCIKGQYQFQPYQESCLDCPIGRTTAGTGATTLALCIDSCSSGLEYNEQTDSCDICPVGEYREQNVDAMCTPCQPLHTTELPGTATADLCIPSCTVGHFYNANGPSCDPCPVGTYQDQPHQTQCTDCPAGTFSSSEAASDLSQCIGPCGLGAELIADGLGVNCQSCAQGYYKTAVDVLCQMCQPAGFTTAASGTTDPAECVPPCMAGYAWNGVMCVKCDFGAYQVNMYSYGCDNCDVGLSTADLGSDSQTLCIDICSSGLELQFNRQCVACKKNYYRQKNVDRQCKACPGAFFTIFDGAISIDQCLPMCDVGSHWDETAGQCVPCAVGYYQDEQYQRTCKSCGAGRTTVDATRSTKVTGATSISQCAGDCVAGMRWDSTSCVECEKDSYQDKPFRDVCKDCIMGYITDGKGSTLMSQCSDPCENGRTWDGTNCVSCGFNRYRDRNIHNICRDCDQGFITESEVAMSVDECKPDCAEGTYWYAVLQVCVPCKEGFHQPDKYQDSCIMCPVGMTTSGLGATACITPVCTATEFDCVTGPPRCIPLTEKCDGTLQCTDDSDEANCQMCPAGQETNPSGIVCVDCPIGEYKSVTSDKPCDTCPTGFVTATTRSTSLNDCRPDCVEGERYDVATAACVPCKLGTYQDMKYQYSCTPCAPGTTTGSIMSTAASDCTDNCGLGKQLAADGVSCVDCEKGEFKASGGTAICQRCPTGFTTVGAGSTECIPDCPAGQRRNSADTGCIVCEMRTYQDLPLQTVCKPCPDGTSTPTTGSTTCIDVCSDGFELQTDGTCRPCPKGTYRTMMVGLSNIQATCVACLAGYTTEDIGQPSAEKCLPDCPAGQFDASATTTPLCTACLIGQYQNLPYQTTCKPCATWKTTAGPGADEASDCFDPCDSGVEYRAGQCNHDCPRGEYREKDVDAACVSCQTGFTTVAVRSGSSADCVPNCAAGEEWDPINTVCSVCPENTHQPKPYSFSCIACAGDRPISPPVVGTATGEDRKLCIGNCAAGERWNYVTERCNWCNIGFYGPAGQDACTRCPTYMTTEFRYSTSINDCIPDCTVDTFWNTVTMSCDACPAGRFQPAQQPHGEMSCNNNRCVAGTRFDATTCVPCSLGMYQPLSGQMTCLVCPSTAPTTSADGTKCIVECTTPGEYWLSTSPTTGSCQPCPAGQYQLAVHQEACMPCAQGRYQDQVGQITCIDCPNDWHTKGPGADSVNDCQADWCGAGNVYIPAIESCIPCGRGFYRQPLIDTECKTCPYGTTTGLAIAGSYHMCVPICRPGKSWNKWKRRCCNCHKGFYQPQAGEFSCLPCPKGMTTKRWGATSSLACYDPCRSGYEYMDCKCLPCRSGLYKKRSESSVCIPCPAMTTTYVRAASDIRQCTAVPCAGCIDLVIMVDMSRSLAKLEFYAIKDFLKTLVLKFRVSITCTRIGIYAFAKGLRKIRQLHEGVSQRSLSYHISKLLSPSYDSEVNSRLALQRMREMIRDEGRSAGIPKHGLLISDSSFDDLAAAQAEADMLHNMGVQMTIISTDPINSALGTAGRPFYQINDYLHLPRMETIVQDLCTP